MLFLGIDTEEEWINETVEIPIIGHFFIFALAFIPPAVCSFITQLIIPQLNNDIGFTKAMLLLLPSWNILLWLWKIRVYIFFIPSWFLFGVIAIIKVITKDF